MQTLRELHKGLGIKQTLDIYVRNTNKKYHQNWLPDEILGEATAKMIEFNTDGKLRRHSKQYEQIRVWIGQENEIKKLKLENERLETKAKRAEDIVKGDNLKDAYIKTLEEYAFFRGSLMKEERTSNFLKGIGIKYAEYLGAEGIEAAFRDRVKWFKSQM